MKKRREKIKVSLIGFFLLLLPIAFITTGAIVVYYFVGKASNGNVWAVGSSVLAVVVLGAGICTLFDIIRRKRMVERPVNKILEATEKIASGDFSVKLEHEKEYSKFDEYDLIFDNINTMTAELSKNEILKNDFISNMSHEIKTPLTVIQNIAKALQSEKLSNDKKDQLLKGLVSQTKKLSTFIANILKLNKLENQKLIPENETFDLAELLRQCTLQFEEFIEQKGLELVCNIEEMQINGSPSMIEIVVNNLISNAIKFTDKGKISVSLTSIGNHVEISVEDTGAGISKETGEHIFDKFYQGYTSHSSEGNGLGLALVKKVIDVIGGEIQVESKIGKGSKFTLLLKKDKQ